MSTRFTAKYLDMNVMRINFVLRNQKELGMFVYFTDLISIFWNLLSNFEKFEYKVKGANDLISTKIYEPV